MALEFSETLPWGLFLCMGVLFIVLRLILTWRYHRLKSGIDIPQHPRSFLFGHLSLIGKLMASSKKFGAHHGKNTKKGGLGIRNLSLTTEVFTQ